MVLIDTRLYISILLILPLFVDSSEKQMIDSIHIDSATVKKNEVKKKIIVDQKIELTKIKDLIRSASYIYDAASEKNFTVFPSDVEERLKLIKKAYPKIVLRLKDIEKALVVEQYLRYNYGDHEISAADTYEKYSQYKAKRENIEIPSYEQMTPFFESIIVLNGLGMQNELNKIKNKKFKKMNEIASKYNQSWPVEYLTILGHPDECIAYDGFSCLFTVAMYNECVPFIRIPKSVTQDSVINKAIHEILATIRKAQVSKEEGYATTIEGIETVDHILKTLPAIQRYGQHKLLARDEAMTSDTLWKTYFLHYDQFFKYREELIIGIIGSSDSAYIDSIYKFVIQKHTAEKKNSRKKTLQSTNNTYLKWTFAKMNDLPKDIIQKLDTLQQKGDFTKPIKTSYGFFIFILDSIISYKEIPFENATDMLMLLTMRDRNEAYNETDIYDKAYEYYQQNKNLFIEPDTISASLWLIPNDSSKYKHRKIHNNKDYFKRVWSDTSNFKPISVLSVNLPQNINTYVMKQCADSVKDLCIGPMQSIYGMWCFRVDTIRHGGSQLSYSEVKNTIIEELQKQENKSDISLCNASTNWYLPFLALARAYETYLMELYLHATDEQKAEVIKIIKSKTDSHEIFKPKSGVSTIKNNNREIKYMYTLAYKNYMMDKFYKSISEWIAGITLNNMTITLEYSK